MSCDLHLRRYLCWRCLPKWLTDWQNHGSQWCGGRCAVDESFNWSDVVAADPRGTASAWQHQSWSTVGDYGRPVLLPRSQWGGTIYTQCLTAHCFSHVSQKQLAWCQSSTLIRLLAKLCHHSNYIAINPLKTSVAIWVQLWSIACLTGHSWHSGLSIRVPGCQKLQMTA